MPYSIELEDQPVCVLSRHCSYCIVLGVRKVKQSRPMEAILKECLQLAALEYKEVTLLGQTINAYRHNMTPCMSFADLLHYLNNNLPPRHHQSHMVRH